MPISVAKKNVALDAAFPTGSTVYISFHTAYPPTNANECVNQAGATYARYPVVVPAAANGTKTFPGTPVATLDAPGQTIQAIGICSTAGFQTGTVDAWFDNTDLVTAAGDKIDVNTLVINTGDIAGQ